MTLATIETVPNADLYTTIVVRHRDIETAREFTKFAHATWPFLAENIPTQMTAISIGDVVSLSDAVGMALRCDCLSVDERNEFAGDLAEHCFTWAECLVYAEAEWDLALVNGEFAESEA